jgi:hypothetical protein
MRNAGSTLALSLLLALSASPAAIAGGASACPPVEKFAPGVVSLDNRWEWRLSFTPLRTRLYFAATQGWWPGTREKATILTAQRRWDGSWSTPEPASFRRAFGLRSFRLPGRADPVLLLDAPGEGPRKGGHGPVDGAPDMDRLG